MTKSDITIGVVDDDPSVCKALSRLIKSVGFRVIASGSAQEFLDGGAVAFLLRPFGEKDLLEAI